MFPYSHISKHQDWIPDLFVTDSESLNERDKYGNSLLNVAAIIGNSEAVQHLLNVKADPNNRNFFAETPLILASVKDHSEVVRNLLNADCDVNSRDNYGNCALSWAAYLGRLEI